jgi:homoserine O-acetyltransferase/O-succinyltransferase
VPVFVDQDFRLDSGTVLPQIEIAWESWGTLSPDRSNAILVTHGLTSSHHAADAPTLDCRIGWGHAQIGPGRIYDTDRYFVLASNVLGSFYGSTCAAFLNPATDAPWGEGFPAVTMADVVRAQGLLLDSLGITRLHAVAGCSLGGFQAYQWAVTLPDRMTRVIATDTADHDSFDLAAAIPGLLQRFQTQSGWNDGKPAHGALVAPLTALREEMLAGFGLREKIALLTGDPAEQARMLTEEARAWAQIADPWSLVSMYRTAASFDVRQHLGRIRVPVLVVTADTDLWYPPAVGRAQVDRLRAAGVQVTYLEIQSGLGHYATTEEPWKWAATAKAFLDTHR